MTKSAIVVAVLIATSCKTERVKPVTQEPPPSVVPVPVASPSVLAPFDANAIAAAWVDANDHRDVEALAKLWAGDVDGVLVAGPNDLRTDRQFNGTQWAKQRKAWFEKMPAVTDVAHSDWTVSHIDEPSRGIALVVLVPTWGSASASVFRSARLFIVRRDEGVVIQREEVALAQPEEAESRPMESLGGPAAEFFHAVSRVQDQLWATLGARAAMKMAASQVSSWNAPVFGSEHDGTVTIISSQLTGETDGEPAQHRLLLSREHTCETTLAGTAAVEEVNVPLTIMKAWQSDPSLAAATMKALLADRYAPLSVRLSGPCAGDWLVATVENATPLIASPPDAAVIELAQKDLSTTPRWLAAQAAYDANHGEGLWMDKMQFGLWTSPAKKQTYLYAFITGGEWCTGFDEAIGSLWRVVDNGKKLIPIGGVAKAPAPQGGGEAWFADLGSDIGPSLFTNNDGYSPTPGGWQRIAHRSIADFSSICPPEQKGK